MSTRNASILATILSMLMLLIFAVLGVIFEIIALNGASESQGMRAVGISVFCLGTGAIFLGVLTWKGTAFLIQKFNLNPVLAVILTIALVLLIGGTVSVLSILISIPLARIQ
jgi:hypothetical protein